MSFNELIGNDKIKENLIKVLNNNTMSHSYMFIRKQRYRKETICKRICKRNTMY